MLKQQQQTHMYIYVTSYIFKSVGAFQASFYLKENVMLKLKNKIFKFLHVANQNAWIWENPSMFSRRHTLRVFMVKLQEIAQVSFEFA